MSEKAACVSQWNSELGEGKKRSVRFKALEGSGNPITSYRVADMIQSGGRDILTTISES